MSLPAGKDKYGYTRNETKSYAWRKILVSKISYFKSKNWYENIFTDNSNLRLLRNSNVTYREGTVVSGG